MTPDPEPAGGDAGARVDVVNSQRKHSIDARCWREFGGEALRLICAAEKMADGASATVAFVGDRTIRRLNREFRGKDAVTDVLSFPNERDADELVPAARAYLGDVVICAAQAERQAAENGLSFDDEIAQLIVHGLLHLCGYDHATDGGEMNRLELRLRRRLGIG